MPALLSAQPPSAAAPGASRRSLHRIRERSFHLAWWERRLPREAAAHCGALAARRDFDTVDVTADSGPALIAALMAAPVFASAAADPAAHWLLEDIADLGGDLSTVADCAEVRVRLSRVADRGCSAFHVDTLPVRLLCTYAGPGMQWADEPHIRRHELGVRGRAIEEANAAIVPDPAHIRTMPTGAVAVFKGRLWPGEEGRGLVHRSYPVCCGDHARLRLVIDPAGHGY